MTGIISLGFGWGTHAPTEDLIERAQPTSGSELGVVLRCHAELDEESGAKTVRTPLAGRLRLGGRSGRRYTALSRRVVRKRRRVRIIQPALIQSIQQRGEPEAAPGYHHQAGRPAVASFSACYPDKT